VQVKADTADTITLLKSKDDPLFIFCAIVARSEIDEERKWR
jgi:hypothetical protein